MNCAESRPLLHAYFDGELDLVRSLEVQLHINSCAACAAQNRSLQSLRVLIRDADLSYRAPDSLRSRVPGIAPAPTPAEEKSDGADNEPWYWQWLAAGATAFAACVLLFRPLSGTPEGDHLVDEAVAGHVRSLMVNHLMDVASSDQHTVKPWFNGKLDFAPDVKDFAAQDFPLVGGRLDYLNNRPVAALVYQRNKHFINVFVWPEGNSNAAQPAPQNLRGYWIINRQANGLHYCLVSDLNEKELGDLADLLGK
jgi:anti-sigma factor RsiW